MRVSQNQGVPRAVDDASIPLLTELLPAGAPPKPVNRSAPATLSGLPPLDIDVTLPPAANTLRADLARPEHASGFFPAPPSFPLPAASVSETVSGAVQTDELLQLREAVLKAVHQNLADTVEGIVRQHVSAAIGSMLREVVEPLVLRLTAETRSAATANLRQIVDQAIAAELARVRSGRG